MAESPNPTRTTARLTGLNVGAGETVGVCVSADVPVTAGVDVTDGVFAGDTVEVPVALAPNDPVAVPVMAAVEVAVPVGVMLQKRGAVEYGAGVTPRNTVLVGAVARTVFTKVTVLYEYNLVGDVRYSMNAPHVLSASLRPAMEMIMVPDSISALVGTVRLHTPDANA